MPPSQLVYPFEIGVAQQPRAAGESSLASWPFDTLIRLFRQTGGHSVINIRTLFAMENDADGGARATLDYSRKPGFTETRLRPLARRRDKTFWPPWVFMRVRNPCFLDRLRRLGWNVRLGMKSKVLL